MLLGYVYVHAIYSFRVWALKVTCISMTFKAMRRLLSQLTSPTSYVWLCAYFTIFVRKRIDFQLIGTANCVAFQHCLWAACGCLVGRAVAIVLEVACGALCECVYCFHGENASIYSPSATSNTVAAVWPKRRPHTPQQLLFRVCYVMSCHATYDMCFVSCGLVCFTV